MVTSLGLHNLSFYVIFNEWKEFRGYTKILKFVNKKYPNTFSTLTTNSPRIFSYDKLTSIALQNALLNFYI